MKRWMPLGIVLITVMILAYCLSGTAIDPVNFTGEWYSADDASLYIFRDGISTCENHHIAFSDRAIISGAYSFCKDSAAVFAIGVDGLETVNQLYLVRNSSGDALCESRDGSGRIFFYRTKTDAIKSQ